MQIQVTTLFVSIVRYYVLSTYVVINQLNVRNIKNYCYRNSVALFDQCELVAHSFLCLCQFHILSTV